MENIVGFIQVICDKISVYIFYVYVMCININAYAVYFFTTIKQPAYL